MLFIFCFFLPVGIDMDHAVLKGRVGGLQHVVHIFGDGVGLDQLHLTVHSDFQIHIKFRREGPGFEVVDPLDA